MNRTYRNWMRGWWLWGLIAIMVLTSFGTIATIYVDEDSGRREVWIVALTMLLTTALVLSLHSWITIQPDRVRFGYFPMYWKTLRYHEIAAAESVTFNGMRDFGGWGVKGKADSANGMLLASSGDRGVRITTRGDRRYVIANEHADEIADLIRGRIG